LTPIAIAVATIEMSVKEMALPDKDRPTFPMAGIGRAILKRILGRLFLSADRDKGKGRPR
jgi:hypothetical protein